MNTKDIIASFFAKDGLSRLTDLLAYEDNTLGQSNRIEFKMIWPLIYSIPFIFENGNLTNLPASYQHFTEVNNSLHT